MSNLPRIIGIAGPARAGKDTFAGLLLGNGHSNGIMVSLSTPMKIMLMEGLGLSREQVYGDLKEAVDSRYGKSPREMMQTLGTEWGRNLVGKDMWLNALNDKYRNQAIVIADIRFNNEACWVRDNGGIMIHISRNQPRILSSKHPSEAGVHIKQTDFLWSNNGSIEDLQKMAIKTIVYLQKGNRL